MPRVPGYQSEVGLPDTTPRARFDAPRSQGGIGAAVAQGMQQVGKALGQRAEFLKETRDHEEAAAAGLKLQELLAETDQYERGWERGDGEDASESGDGMTRAVLGRFDQRASEVAGQIANPQIRIRFETQAAEHRRRYAARSQDTEDKKLGVWFSDQNTQTATLASNRARESNDPTDVGQTLTDLGDIVAGYNLTDQQKAALNRFNSKTIKSAFLDGQVERNPANAIKLLDEGFAGDLPPALVDQYRDEANAAIRAREAQGRAAQAQALAVLKDQLGAVEQTLNAGGGTAKDRTDLADQYAGIGDKSKEAYWRVKAVEFQAVQGTKDLTLPQIDAEIARLIAKQGSGDGLTGGEAALLNGLKDQRTQVAARLGQDGGALAQTQYATGQPVTPLDPRDSGSFQRRAREAVAAAGAYGRWAVEPLMQSDPIYATLKDLVESGDPAQQRHALDAIAQFRNPRAILGAARQIAGEGNGAFRIAATRSLQPAGREVAGHILAGKAALEANPKLWERPNEDNTKMVSAEDDARTIFNEYSPALAGQGASAAADTYAAAKAYYASKMQANGQTQFNGDSFRQSIETVLGRYSQSGIRYGGTTYINGQRTVVPEGWTGEGMAQRLRRATSEDWVLSAGNRVPVWADGSPLYTGQLRELVPVNRGGGYYVLKVPRTGNIIQAKGGGEFLFDIGKMPYRQPSKK